MSATSDFYLARADECANKAERSPLSNVRERAMRSEFAWRALAARVVEAEANRQRQVAEKEVLAANLQTS